MVNKSDQQTVSFTDADGAGISLPTTILLRMDKTKIGQSIRDRTSHGQFKLAQDGAYYTSPGWCKPVQLIRHQPRVVHNYTSSLY